MNGGSFEEEGGAEDGAGLTLGVGLDWSEGPGMGVPAGADEGFAFLACLKSAGGIAEGAAVLEDFGEAVAGVSACP